MYRHKQAESKAPLSPPLPSVVLMILCNDMLTGNTLKKYIKDYRNNNREKVHRKK